MSVERGEYNIMGRLGMECGIGLCSGLLVSPLITVIDKAIIQNANGSAKLLGSCLSSLKSLGRNPL